MSSEREADASTFYERHSLFDKVIDPRSATPRDNITRDLLTSGTLKRYIDELSITGLTSNPTIFDQAIKNSTAYDSELSAEGSDSERVLAGFRKPGVDLDALAGKLQEEGAAAFVASWNELLGVIASKSASLTKAS